MSKGKGDLVAIPREGGESEPTTFAITTAEKPKHPGGRPTDYNQDLAEHICERISNGESLKKITDEEGMPSRVSVHAWLIRYPEFLNKYNKARDMQADVYADEMDDIAHNEEIDVARAKLIIDTRKWTASKLKPKKYGDKLDMTTDGKAMPTPILGNLIVPLPETKTLDD